MGNPILTDDGVGFHVAKQLKTILDDQQVTVTDEDISGLNLLEMLIDYDKVVIIDAIQTPGGTAGHIYRLEPASFNYSLHSSSPHDVNLVTALEFGRQLKIPLPQDIIIYAIEVEDVKTFSEKCTTEVQQVISQCVDMVVEELHNSGYKEINLA